MLQVDIFSLGLSLYEVMTLRKLPPEGSGNEFTADIIAGRRPEFLPEVRKLIYFILRQILCVFTFFSL